jgi:hypothetical protein
VEGEDDDGQAASVAAPARAAAASPPRCNSALFALLVYLWSWGCLSLPFAQQIAKAACTDLDNARAPPYHDLLVLSRLGNSGKYPNNMQRDLLRHLEEPVMSKPRFVELPIKINQDLVSLGGFLV